MFPTLWYRITRMFCEHQTFANFAMVDQFATIKSAKPKLLLVNTHDPYGIHSWNLHYPHIGQLITNYKECSTALIF